MALNLDDGEKKTSTTTRDILDLSHVTVRSEQELKKLLEKIPDFKIRPEKVRNEDIQFDNNAEERSPSGSPSPSHDEASGAAPYLFTNPVPASMRDVNIRELGRVNINWRMLTMARPKSKTEEEIFTRLVQLEKLQYQTTKWENEQEALRERKKLPFTRGPIPRGRSHGGALASGRGASTKAAVTEIRLQTCKECGEEFCSGTCKKYLYDDHARILNPLSNEEIFKVVPTNPVRKQKTVKISPEESKSKAVNDTSESGKLDNGKGLCRVRLEPKKSNETRANKGPVDLTNKGAKPKTSHSIKKHGSKRK